MGAFAQAATPLCRQSIESALAILKERRAASSTSEAARKTSGLSSCWRETPESFRKLIVRSAGLPADVVGKLDRDLTETEKAMIRAAAKRLKERADALFAL
jgi:hypothetical protein